MTHQLHLGDCLDVLATFEPDSIDTFLSDPPYGISFMNSAWDHDVPGPEHWRAALRVAKPGAMLLAFGGTRTSHRLACAIQDAGWELRDAIGDAFSSEEAREAFLASLTDEQRKAFDRAFPSEGLMAWLYGQGFPKSLNGPWGGTALKPAWEPIIVARKPLVGTVAQNFARYGTGGLDIDAARVGVGETVRGGGNGKANHGGRFGAGETSGSRPLVEPHTTGRWPANIIFEHDPECERVGMKRVKGSAPGPRFIGNHEKTAAKGAERAHVTFAHSDPDGTEQVSDWRCVEGCPVRALDEQSGIRKSGGGNKGNRTVGTMGYGGNSRPWSQQTIGDAGAASRFFFCAKASKRDRGEGNDWPTVKPTDLMRYLVRLVCPPGGTVLDHFMGSGSTGKAALLEGRRFIGIDRDPRAFEIAKRRLAAVDPLLASEVA